MVDIHNLSPHFAPSSRLSSVRFLTYSSEDIKKISCKKITNPNTFDSLLHPNMGSLYDPALGPCDKLDLCGTCGLNYVHCPGHMGHIPLPLPVYHPIFFMTMYQLLRGSCWNCHRLLCTPYKAHLLIAQLELIECGLLSDALELETAVSPDGPDASDKFQDHADSVIQLISQYVQTRKIVAASDPLVTRVTTKNLVELKNVLVNDLFKHCSSSTKKCSHCSAPIRRVRHENRTRVFLRSLSKKNAGMWLTAHKLEKQRKADVKNTRQTNSADSEEDSEGEHEATAALSVVSAGGIQQTESEMTVDECSKQRYITPTEVREHIRGLWDNQRALMEAIFCSMKSASGRRHGDDSEDINPADMFFLGVVPVPPSRFRPISQLGDKRFENPQTSNLHYILVDCIAIHELMEEKHSHEELGLGEEDASTRGRGRRQQSFSERLQAAWVKLQHDVNCFMDSSCDKKGSAPNGIKQIMEKKEGLFRKHMMGKRVDYAARSVISPDPYINMDEIGIPKVFATRLTYPQPVTHWNVKDLRQAVINGPKVHPGATHVQNEDGSIVLLSASNRRQRYAIAKKLLTPSKEGPHGGASKKVFRHLNDGDILLLNRQPTLHKPSIMAHKARVLSGEKTLRLHYANCKSYNADFDGDEMNAHFPQNELARAEAYSIVSTHHQYLVPKDGTPLSGLIQDHVVSGVLMTIRGRMFNRADYMQLVFSALPRFSGHFKTLPPCIWKPERLWSGKQVVSTLLLNIIPEDQDKLNLLSKSKIADKEWSRRAGKEISKVKERKKKKKKKAKYSDDIMTESEVVFRQGELLCGVLDKSQFGASQYGFVHSCFELYGGSVANLLLSALGRLFTTFLQLHGFTLGVEDILVTEEADAQRRDIIAEGRGCGSDGAAEAFGLTEPTNTDILKEKYEAAHRSQDGTGIKTLDFFMKKKTDHYNNLINSTCVPVGLHKPFPANCLQLMVQAGAKGSTVNCMQISCLLGQIELEGKRPPLMASGRFLPSFLPYDTSPRAGGFVDGRFLTGIRPQEYFFHCMAGREGLVDTAVKTSRSGYLQRCLIKHLEGICVAYDLTVRDSDGSVVQFLYGEDGMDISKTSFLKEKQFPFLVNNYQALLYNLNAQAAVSVLDSKKVHKYQKKLSHWSKRHGSPVRSTPRRTGFLDFSEKHLPEMRDRFPEEERSPSANCRTKAELEVIDLWYGMSPMARASITKKFSHAPSPIVAHLRPDRHFGSVPDKLIQQVDSFIDRNPQKILSSSDEQSSNRLAPEKFHSLVQFKYLRSLTDPGEAVGLLAAQSIGEPSTQMTLNTFHFAGRGEMNVTLGIPRLREILMTASPNIKTPAMDVPLLNVEGAKERGEKLKKMFTRVCISEVLEKVEVWESLGREGKGHQHRLFKVKLSFLPHQYYSEDFVVSPSGILGYVERVFIKKLVAAVKKEMNLIKEKRTKSVSVEKDLLEGSKSSSHGNDKGDGDKEASATQGSKDDDDEEEDLSDMDEGDADATSAKQLARRKEQAGYEDPGESDDEVMEGQKGSDAEFSDDDEISRNAHRGSKQSQDQEGLDEDDGDDMVGENLRSESSSPMDTSGMDSDRVQEVLMRNSAVTEYFYDSQEEEWCQFTLNFPLQDSKVMLTSVIEKLAPKAIVWETPQINRGYLSESNEPGEDGVWRLKTDGVNLQVLWHHSDILDLSRVYTNNIHAMANTYGIEAAYKAIIKEISGVFKVYGITVDYHHLSLIADYMTFEGTYKPFNRIGMETNSSPFQKMSFETTMHFLKNATIAGDTDPIRSPSACLVAGRVVKGGTGSFELLQRLI